MLIHIYIAEPARVTLVIPLKISHKPGEFGTVLTARVPTLVGGLGSVTDLRLRIGRRFEYRGARRSYLSAACAAPAGFPGGTFSFARGTFSFEGGLHHAPHAHPQLSGSEAGRIGVTVRQRNRRGVE